MKTLVIQKLLWAAPLLIILLVNKFIYGKENGHKHIYPKKLVLNFCIDNVVNVMR
jgi:hypothetical protein